MRSCSPFSRLEPEPPGRPIGVERVSAWRNLSGFQRKSLYSLANHTERSLARRPVHERAAAALKLDARETAKCLSILRDERIDRQLVGSVERC